MALLQRTRILPNQRLDKPDFDNIEDFVCADFKAIQKNIWANNNFIYSGFVATGTGTSQLSVALAGSSLTVAENDGTMYIGAPTLSPLTTTALTPSATNFVEVFIDQDTGGADSRAFWDQTAAGGAGGEFSQIVDTFIFLNANFAINASAFTGDADKVPVCEVDVNGAGVITEIRDSRNLFWRLGRANDTTFDFPWSSRTEPTSTQFTGADKDISTFKDWADAVMSSIKEIKGTTYWFESSPLTPGGVMQTLGLTTVAPLTSGARVKWDGSNVQITDDSLTPAVADAVAAVRVFNSSENLRLTRQDDGKEVVTISLDAVPDSGTLTLDQDGNSIAIDWDDDTAAIQSTWDGAASEAATITGSPAQQLIVITYNTVGNKVDVTTDTNTLQKNAVAVNETITIKQGQTADNSIALADGEILWVELPDPLAATDYTGVGVIASNYRVSARGSVPLDQSTYWLAYREGSKLIWRGVGELETGESSEIGDNVPTSLLTNIGLTDEVTPPSYSSDIRGLAGESIVSRVGVLTDAVGDSQEDRSAYLRSDDEVTWTGTELQFAADIELVVQNTKDGTETVHSILQANSPIAIADLESIYVAIDREDASETVTPVNSGTTPIPAQSQANKDVFVLFKRQDASGVQVLHLPFHKQALDPGQTVRLGASGSGSGAGSDAIADYKRRLVLSPFNKVSAVAFAVDKDVYVDGSSTGAFSPADRAFEFTAGAQTLVDTQNLDDQFLTQGLDPRLVELYVQWQDGAVDTGATYEMSINGGTDWEAITMSRIAETNAYRGVLEFTDPADEDLQEYDVVNADSQLQLNDTSGQARAQELVVTNTQFVRELDVYMNKLGAPTGNLTVKIVKDDSSAPSTSVADIVSESDPIDITGISTGDSTVTADMANVILTAGTYWIVWETDADYKASFSAAVDELRVRADVSSPSVTDAEVFDGTSWSTVAGSAHVYLVKGTVLDLRTRITSSVASLIDSYGVFYEVLPGVTQSGQKKVDKFVFTGDENRTDFALSFFPDPDLLTIYDVFRGQTYVVDNDVIRIDGQTVKFEADFFDDPGETILLHFRQNENALIDDSTQNANKIATIEAQLVDIGDELDSLTNSMVFSKIPVPNTQIVGRSQIVDLANDLKPRFGVERLAVQDIYEIKNEKGPNGEQVFGVLNDTFDQIRFVGPTARLNNALGIRPSPADGSFIEITFFGTKLNLLTHINTSAELYATVDGGSEGSNFMPTSGSGVIGNRNHAPNNVINVVSGLSQGLHTVKIRVAVTDAEVYGFEIINEEASGNIVVNPGTQLHKGKRRQHVGQTLLNPRSGFETGTLGTTGAAGLIYQKSGGSVAHAINPVAGSPSYLGSANHGNEDLQRVYFFREFGYGRSDDMSFLMPSAEDAAWVKEDGQTVVTMHDMANNSAHIDGFFPNGASNSFFTIGFVGTGIDLELFEVGSPASVEVFVDNVSQGNLPNPGLGDDVRYTQPICSDLPYGYHTVRLFQSAVGNPSNTFYFEGFKVWKTKTPSLPAEAVEIGSYYIPGDYSLQTNQDARFEVSQGVIRNFNNREAVYEGTWSIAGISIDTGADSPSGFLITAETSGAASQKRRFEGTGVDVRMFTDTNRHGAMDVLIDGVQLTTANFPGVTTNFSGPASTSWTAATGVLDGKGTAGYLVLSIEGLSDGEHEIEISVASTSGSDRLSAIDALDAHATIHSDKISGEAMIADGIDVGSQSIKDLRRLSRKDFGEKFNFSRCDGINGNFGQSVTTLVPTGDQLCPIFVEGPVPKAYDIEWTYEFENSTGSAINSFAFFVDGKNIAPDPNEWNNTQAVAGGNAMYTLRQTFVLSPGWHFIKPYTRVGSGTGQFNANRRQLVVTRAR